MKTTLPLSVALHLAGAVDALKLADDAFGVALESLQPIALEEQPVGVGSFDVIGYRESVRLFLGLFAGVADGFRLAPCSGAVREHIQGCTEDPRNPAGLERAALALQFAVASIEDAVDSLDRDDADGAGDAWHGKLLAAGKMSAMIHVAIEGALIRPHRPRGFSSN